MGKDAYYFFHDSNSKDDPKCVLLIEQLGLEGYGIFWVLIETLRDQSGYKYPLNLVSALARRYNTTTEKMKAVITNYNLFQIDDKEFFSASLIRRMETLDHKREIAIKAGKASAEKRLLLNGGSTTIQQPLNISSTTVQPLEEKRVEENKLDKNREDKEDNTGEVFSLYEENIGMVTPIISDRIKSTLKEYSADLIKSAICKAAEMEKRSWSYVEGILKGWKRDGYSPSGVGGNSHKKQGTNPDPWGWND